VNQPSPAIVAQAAVRRFPRIPLLLLCVAYVFAGYVGRDAWKSADMTALGYMAELAAGGADWFYPTLLGRPTDSPVLLPYWIGAWALALTPQWMSPDFVVRIPFGILLALAMVSTWYGTYYLARNPQAQPVAFAFGGEASPTDYARTIADGAVLALIASLGLAHLSHETTPAVAQLAFAALYYFAISTLPYHRHLAAVAAMLGLTGLALSGAPMLATLIGLGSAALHSSDRHSRSTGRGPADTLYLLVLTAGVSILATSLDLWRWKIEWPASTLAAWNGYAQLLVWFTWPAWPLTLVTVWHWRRHLFNRHISRHLAWPGGFALAITIATLMSSTPDRTLLLALPALATLAAFALPTLKRQVASLIDWFTLLFFSSCGLTIWVVWIAMETGYPQQPAANVARLVPGFVPSFSLIAFVVALLATAAWAWLVRWRVGRHRAAIWKSLVLPAGGAALCWLLLMTLWMPLLNFTQSYSALVQKALKVVGPKQCVEVSGLGQGAVAAFQFYGKLDLKPMQRNPVCQWLMVEPGPDMGIPKQVDGSKWAVDTLLSHKAGDEESVLLLRKR
jgi:hypothetical protein